MIPRRARRVSGAVLAVLAALTGLVVLAGPASAHTELESSSPAEGAALDTAPTQVELKFGEPVTLPPDPIAIDGRDGVKWKIGTPVVEGGVVTVPVTPAGSAQAYSLAWKVVAKDGDNVSGTVRFTLTAPVTKAAATGSPAPVTLESAGIPKWVWVLVAVAGLLAVIVVGIRRLRARPKD
ncbi:copper resistance protein CopC [Amycolatopsis sp. FBCC-B4732]|uniref:copper resistance CopC family protein n=1 Tax=Amycolatopsis sp. FBCC-B4732 TaxID=3079339 RepID=UPI001FF209F8|nr:copper resistance CopC family protein [Amycolatopsis sp. FBCC-B4732]UOX92333.1 copper resistance protein CopC [Amycolatopsis sp. FBCC-B4732]